MSGIILSSSVRQNLLSLQSTADLLSTTQNRLATGKKVNTALDNPTNFFTAQSLDNRASDINNLLDGIGNGVQVLQSANTGITSLQKLVDTASQSARAALVTQYNNTIAQITTTAQDASFNGINLLSGDSLKLTFNETGKSTLSITGVTFDATGLGLRSLVSGTDFLDNNSA